MDRDNYIDTITGPKLIEIFLYHTYKLKSIILYTLDAYQNMSFPTHVVRGKGMQNVCESVEILPYPTHFIESALD